MSSSNSQSVSAASAASSNAPMWRAAWVVTAVFILSNAATPLYGHWRAEFGFGAATQATIFSSYVLGLLGTLLVAGQLADHFGRKAVLVPALIVAMVADVLFGIAVNVPMLMLARFLLGGAIAVIVSAGMANVVENASEARKREASLIASIAMVFGAGLGPFYAGLLAQFLHNAVPLVFGLQLVLLALALACVSMLPRRATPQKHFRVRLPSVPREHVAHVWRGISFFGPGLTGTSFVLSLGPNLFASALHSNSPLIAGGTAFAMFMTAVGVQMVARRYSLRATFIASGCATILSMTMLWLSVQTASVGWLVGAALMAGAGQGLGQLGGLTAIALNVPAERRAEANGLMNMGGYVPAGLLPIAAGVAIDRLGLLPGVSLLAGAIGVLAVLALTMLRRR